MLSKIFTITIVYFLIGFIATVIVNRKADHITRWKRWRKYFVYLLIVHIMITIIYWNSHYFLIIAIAIILAGAYELLANYYRQGTQSFYFLAYSLSGYLVLSSGFILFALLEKEDITFVYLLVIVFDGFSQICGQLTGKRKFTSISPNKTIEGLAGGLLFTIATAVLYTQWIKNFESKAITYSIMISMASLTGDLLASWYKRKVGIKDFSQLIPGHGGVLDRFDSFMAAGAAWYVMVLLGGR